MENHATRNLIDIKKLSKKINLGKTSIYYKINPKSKYYDPTFPQSITISESRVAWIETEIDSWIQEKILQRSSAIRNNSAKEK